MTSTLKRGRSQSLVKFLHSREEGHVRDHRTHLSMVVNCLDVDDDDWSGWGSNHQSNMKKLLLRLIKNATDAKALLIMKELQDSCVKPQASQCAASQTYT